jgi:hypothetical protein
MVASWPERASPWPFFAQPRRHSMAGPAAKPSGALGEKINCNENKACQKVLNPTCEVSFKLLIRQRKFP